MTAVEWLVSELRKPHADKFITHIIHKALEMEREQILKAYDKGYDDVDVYEPEKYYNEIYKKDNQ